jgi:hypothetical protein
LRREFHAARQNAAQPHRLPILSVANASTSADLLGIGQALVATRHLLEVDRRQAGDEQARRTLQRPGRRLLAVASRLEGLAAAEK